MGSSPDCEDLPPLVQPPIPDRRPDGQENRDHSRRHSGHPDGLRLAGQRSGIEKRHRACDHHQQRPPLFLFETLAAIATQPAPGPEETPQIDSLAAVERRHISRVLQATGWRISGEKEASAVLGLNPSTLRYRIIKLQIRRPWKGRA